MPQTLIVMRLADMERVHPQQDNSHKCGRCQQQLGMYPSGQAALRANPSMEVVCQVCGLSDKFDIVRPAAGGDAEMEAESLASIPVRHT
jgi:hypothetical protein